MNPFERVALGAEAMRRTLGELRRPPRGGSWALLALVLALAVTALAYAAHPWVSWLLAPLLEPSGIRGVLRYPGHFESLPVLTRRAMGVATVTVVPLLSALTMIEARARWTGTASRSNASPLARLPLYLLAPLPVTLLVGGMHAALPLLAEVRLSSVTRAAVPHAVSFLSLVLVASWAWMLPRVALARRPLLAAWREWPRHVARGLVPSFVLHATVLLALMPLDLLLDSSADWIRRGRPEMVILWALVRVGAMVGAAWFLALGMGLLHEAVRMDEGDA